ncbi:uncharacterized protein LOC121282007 [Carcharodon carcharias]|uniref:uncharacterized protein LOC121282007 n=1 Tax=Carcharodon carcharias TaxID=13397 RepID=UPI001B7DF659|nr:uncharacterized protein LOC121282007 [Carcharodon carcharias]
MCGHSIFTHQKQARTMELIALLILISGSSLCQLIGPKKVHGELGGSVTVNCQYDLKYMYHVKRWCKGLQHLIGTKKVHGELGGSVTVKCQYDLKYKDHDKRWCKGSYSIITGCSIVVSTEKPKRERVSLADNKTQGIFSVTMDHLIKSDEGQYLCVIVRPGIKLNEKFSIELEVSEGPLWSSTQGPTTRKAGNTKTSVTTALTTSSTSDSSEEDELKSYSLWAAFRWPFFGALVVCTLSVTFCKRPSLSDFKWKSKKGILACNCYWVIAEHNCPESRVEFYGAQKVKGSTMSGQREYTHQKQCRTMELITLLILMPASSLQHLIGPKKVHGELGGSVTVKCQYDLKYKDLDKRWCKGSYSIITGCSIVVSTEKPKRERVSLADNKTQGIFSVTMDHLIKSDEGQYLCVIVRPGIKLNEKFSIELEVSEGPLWSSTQGPTTRKAGNTKTSVTTALTTSSTSDSSDEKQWHVILPAIMVLIILLLVAAIILYVKLKRQKKRGMNEQNFTGMENPAEACKFSKEDKEVTYSTVKTAPRANLEKTYYNLQDLKAERTAEGQDASETVEYSTVYFKS